MTDLETFLAGRAPDYVAIVIDESLVDDPDAIAEYAEPIDSGQALVLGGATGRSVFEQVTGEAAMAFARSAGEREGRVQRDLAGGACPDTGPEADHRPTIVLSFAEPRHGEADGLYAEGPVVHAYVQCACGTRYSDKWVVDVDPPV